jgi:hypothetical protein
MMTAKAIIEALKELPPFTKFDILLDGEYIGQIESINYDDSPYKDHYINIKSDKNKEK